MSLTQFVVPTFSQMLRSLSGWLDKAAAHETAGGAEGDALMAKRLAPDMYPLSSQVRFACFQALEVAARLRSQPLPPSAEKVRSDGWSGGEQPGSIADAKACVAQTLAVLADLGPGALDGGSAAPVVIELRDGIIFDLDGEKLVRDWSIPQFYFHVTIAYAILRHHGVALGKADLVPHMLSYVRPGSMPSP